MTGHPGTVSRKSGVHGADRAPGSWMSWCHHSPSLANLPTASGVGRIANMKAELITRFKDITDDGGVIELVVWRVPQPVPPTSHGYK